MTVGTFIQPLFGTQEPTAVKTNIQNCIAVMARIAASFAPHEQDTPNMTVRVDAGCLSGLTGPIEVAGQNSVTITAPVTNPRIDRIVINSSTGTIAVITGTEAASPTAPNITSGYLPCCKVALATSTTSITNSLITDERVLGGGGANADIPVGGLFLTTANYAGSSEVAAAKGYGTWVYWGQGRMLIGVDASDPSIDSAEKTTGSKTKNIAHTHNFGTTVPPLKLGLYTSFNANTINGIALSSLGPTDPGWREGGIDYITESGSISSTTNSGGSSAQDVMPPVIAAYMWKRTA